MCALHVFDSKSKKIKNQPPCSIFFLFFLIKFNNSLKPPNNNTFDLVKILALHSWAIFS